MFFFSKICVKVDVHKFEIDRIKGELTRLKKEYFKRRADEDKVKLDS